MHPVGTICTAKGTHQIQQYINKMLLLSLHLSVIYLLPQDNPFIQFQKTLIWQSIIHSTFVQKWI